MTNSLTTGPSHLTFDQVGDLYDAGRASALQIFPCECWLAGNGGKNKAASYQHPEEFIAGARSRFEQENDL